MLGMSRSKENSPAVKTTRTFPSYRFAGTHRQIGQQYGEACASLIHRHRDLVLERLKSRSGAAPAQALEEALRYRLFVSRYASFLDEEIQGMAEGANISLAEAYLLQLRAELQHHDPAPEANSECTTFAALPEATADGAPLIGQNADLSHFYTDLGVVIEVAPDDTSATLMLTPAGQVSYIGINDQGLGVFANFLTCDGWRVGFPRYLLTRLALLYDSVDEAVAAVRGVPRASSRNLIMLDKGGKAADLETTPTEDAYLEPEDGILAHSNHFVGRNLLEKEERTGEHLRESHARLERIRDLLKVGCGRLDVPAMQAIFRDRGSLPHPICRMPGDDDSDTVTFASVIAEPTRGRIWVSVGPPNEHEYRAYTFSPQSETPDEEQN